MSYIGTNVFDIVNIKDNRVGAQLLDKLTRVKDDRRLKPLDYGNNIVYQHRLYYNSYKLQIGDSQFMIPPEFIMITSDSASHSIVTLRQENTQKQKSGYHKRTIMIDLVFNGYDQINGFKVEGPESADGKDYYVDGLRPLLAQFKCTPFLPIINELINGTGIFTVALQSINISTMPGYPEVMKAQIILQEVCMFPYIEQPDFNFQFLIDWDLFRYYYQSFMTEEHVYKRLQSLPRNKEYNRFKISIIDSTIFEHDVNEYNILQIVLDDKIIKEEALTNYTTWIDSYTSDVVITSFQCGYSNILTNLQMAELSTPTVQFIGGMDTIYSITFETTDEKVIQSLGLSQITNDLIIRSNPKIRSSIGFVKLESELVEFTGSLFVMIESVETNTVPGFPGLYSVQMNCVAYDVVQSEREQLNGFKPFDCDKCGDDWDSECEHSEQAIDQERVGWKRKIRQDNYAEWKLRSCIEVYPDLRLPTYNEVNNVIEKIIEFRKNKELTELPYKKYPTRPAVMLHGCNPKSKVSYEYTDEDKTMIDILSIEREEYDGYVDPDFYVFYPNSYESYLDEDPTYYDTFEPIQQQGYTKRKIRYNGTYVGSYADENTITLTGLENFIQLATSFDEHQYVWGAAGALGSDGKPTFDCSGLITYCLKEMGVMPSTAGRLTTHTMRKKEYFEEVSLDNIKRGDLVWRDGHVAIYLGNDEIFHAKGKDYGLRFDKYNKAKYTCGLRIKAFHENTNINYNTLANTSTGTLLNNSTLGSYFLGSISTNNYQSFLDSIKNGTATATNKIPMADYQPVEDLSTMSTGQFYLTQEFVDMVKEFEGYLETPKWLDGGWDIGYGMHIRYYDENYRECKVKEGMKWTEEEAEKYLKIRLQVALARTVKNIKDAGWNLNQFTNNQVLALTSYFFNRSEFNTSAKKILDKSINPTIADIGNSLPEYWGSGKGKPVEGLTKRREDEKAFFFSDNGGIPIVSIIGSTKTDVDMRYAITLSELDDVCRAVMNNVLGEDANSEKAFAQHIYDRATAPEGIGKLTSILNSYGMYSGPLSDTVMDIVKGVFLENEKYNEKALLYCLKLGDNVKVEIDRYDQEHERICEVNTHIYWGSNDSLNSSKQKFTLVDSKDSTGQEADVEETEINTITIENADRFGEPVVIDTEYYRKYETKLGGGRDSGNHVSNNWKENVNTTENSFNTSFCDMHQYSSRGRLVKAFPTYLFCMLDDDSNWFDGRKLWTNYYTYQSVIDISVHGTNDMPTETATILINNSYHNLDRTQGGLSQYSIMNDDEYSDFAKFIYKYTNTLVSGGKFGPRLTKKLIQLHQILYAHAKLREGARVHLRMGYGSDPLSLAPVMNGHISEVALGDQIQIIVTSDAHELVQHVVSAKEGDSNNGWFGIFGIGEKQESSNIIADIMCKRSSWMTYLSKGSFEMSKYSIEHYGLFERQNLGDNPEDDSNKEIKETTAEILDDIARDIGNFILDALSISNILAGKWPPDLDDLKDELSDGFDKLAKRILQECNYNIEQANGSIIKTIDNFLDDILSTIGDVIVNGLKLVLFDSAIEGFDFLIDTDIPIIKQIAQVLKGGTNAILGLIEDIFSNEGGIRDFLVGAVTGAMAGVSAAGKLVAPGLMVTGGTAVVPSVIITVAGGVIGGAIGGTTAVLLGSQDVNISDIWNEYIEQYDICKNIYRASYKRILYCHNDTDGTPGDNEMNIVFTKYNMTPWDMFQMCTQQVPEYIVKSSYHQFDSRLYFGIPFWMEKYRYDVLLDKDGKEKIVEECKTASQVHFIDSMDNIIDNQIRVTSKHSSTNIKVMYLRGKSAVATMEIHSDDTIDMSKQKTKILDTPIMQDAIGPDLIWELVGYSVGDAAARRTGISNLLYGWQQQYQGQIITLGNPGVKPHDYLMINDTYINLFGIALVREVTHSFSTNTGYTTTIVPGMIGFSTDENSGMIEATKSFLSLLACFASYTSTRRGMYQNYEATLGIWADAATLVAEARQRFDDARELQNEQLAQDITSGILDVGGILLMTYSFFRGCSMVLKSIKSAEYLKHGIDLAQAFAKLKYVVGYTSKFKNILKGMGAAFNGAAIAGAPATGGLSIMVGAIVNLAIWLTLDVIFDSVLEYRSNKNVCIVCPLWWERTPFVSGVKDGEKILLFSASGSEENTAEDALYKENTEVSQEDNDD